MVMALITPPAALPVSIAQVKEFLKIENSNDDQLVSDLIVQAVTHIENISDRKIITQSWRVFFDEYPANGMLELAMAPLLAIVECRYFDELGDAQVISPSDYELDFHTTPARLMFKSVFYTGPCMNGLEVDIQIGFGSSAVDVPGDILRAIMLTIAHWYEFRGAVSPSDQPLSNPAGLNSLLAPYCRMKL